MQSKEYIKNAIRTESIPERLEINQFILADMIESMCIMATIGDFIKRKLFYGTPIDVEKLEEEMCTLHTRFSRVIRVVRDIGDIDNRDPQVTPEYLASIPPGSEIGDIDNVDIRLLHCALGIFTESGELLAAIQKQMLTGKMDKVNFGEEVGDVEWYQAIGFDATGVTEESCREANINKLKSRYPDKFNNQDAQVRDLDAERQQLVGGMRPAGFVNKMVDDVNRTEKLFATTDAQIWAQEFIETAKHNGLDPLDESWMTSWFANAIETAREAGRKTGIEEATAGLKTDPAKLVDAIVSTISTAHRYQD